MNLLQEWLLGTIRQMGSLSCTRFFKYLYSSFSNLHEAPEVNWESVNFLYIGLHKNVDLITGLVGK